MTALPDIEALCKITQRKIEKQNRLLNQAQIEKTSVMAIVDATKDLISVFDASFTDRRAKIYSDYASRSHGINMIDDLRLQVETLKRERSVLTDRLDQEMQQVAAIDKKLSLMQAELKEHNVTLIKREKLAEEIRKKERRQNIRSDEL